MRPQRCPKGCHVFISCQFLCLRHSGVCEANGCKSRPFPTTFPRSNRCPGRRDRVSGSSKPGWLLHLPRPVRQTRRPLPSEFQPLRRGEGPQGRGRGCTSSDDRRRRWVVDTEPRCSSELHKLPSRRQVRPLHCLQREEVPRPV